MKKRSYLAVALGSAVLVACAGMTGCGNRGDLSSSAGLAESEQAPELSADELEDPDIEEIPAVEIPETVRETVTISAAGDCTLGVTQKQGYEGSFHAYYDAKGRDYFLQNVKEIFAEDDMTLVNLECVLSESDNRVDKQFNLKGRPEYVQILTAGSVEVCGLGNNHTYDYGEEGYQDTKRVLEEAGIPYACVEQPVMYTTKNGVQIGIVSASLLSQSGELVDRLAAGIHDLREQGAQIVIASCHWGIEREYYPNSFQRETAHRLIDEGADLILGSHPHVLQGMELYQGKMVCYSLGNFCFGGNRNPSDQDTMIFQQTFTLEDGELLLPEQEELQARIIPCRISSANGSNNFQPTPATGENGERITAQVRKYSEPYGPILIDSDGEIQYKKE